MTTAEADPTPIFADADAMSDAAHARLAAGDLRDAAEKAWCATIRATEALVLARTGQEPARSTHASPRLTLLAQSDPALIDLRRKYNDRQNLLHGDCFYHEFCPIPGTEQLIHETSDFIHQAQHLSTPPQQ